MNNRHLLCSFGSDDWGSPFADVIRGNILFRCWCCCPAPVIEHGKRFSAALSMYALFSLQSTRSGHLQFCLVRHSPFVFPVSIYQGGSMGFPFRHACC